MYTLLLCIIAIFTINAYHNIITLIFSTKGGGGGGDGVMIVNTMCTHGRYTWTESLLRGGGGGNTLLLSRQGLKGHSSKCLGHFSRHEV